MFNDKDQKDYFVKPYSFLEPFVSFIDYLQTPQSENQSVKYAQSREHYRCSLLLFHVKISKHISLCSQKMTTSMANSPLSSQMSHNPFPSPLKPLAATRTLPTSGSAMVAPFLRSTKITTRTSIARFLGGRSSCSYRPSR